MTKFEKIAALLYEAGTLRKIARSHRQSLLTDDLSDNIASHSYRVSVIGWILAKMEKADVGKVIQMCLFHDFSEARSGDQNWIHKKYLKVFEEEITQEQFGDKPFGDDLLKILSEYEERESKEAVIAKDADLIDQILLLREYEWNGNKEAKLWLFGRGREGNTHRKILKTKAANKIADAIVKQRPSKWWSDVWTEKRRK